MEKARPETARTDCALHFGTHSAEVRMLNRRKTISKRYVGDLAKPIVRKRPTPPANRFFNPTFDQIQKRYEAECDAEKRKAVDEFFRRIDLLWDRFDIEPGNYKALAISLAHEHVPGL